MDFTTDGGGGKEVKKNEKGYEREREKQGGGESTRCEEKNREIQ